ncbi:Arm DNA-binding domain-containing protein [Dysgonomonas sp. ZJ709]|uniref:Arm DNA-binding domain-containing protein n=1 Tax=Dysgonomonas sp. ZJ709 TaxID=2709797 RepID=UPI00351A4E09
MNVMKSTFRVLFYLRKNEVNKSGNSSIMVRITVNGEQVQFSSKLQIKPERMERHSVGMLKQ